MKNLMNKISDKGELEQINSMWTYDNKLTKATRGEYNHYINRHKRNQRKRHQMHMRRAMSN